MRAVIQRVTRAQVEVEGKIIGEIGIGLLVFVGIGAGDTIEDADYVVDKVAHMRMFEDHQGKMNLSLIEVGGSILGVSQFALYGDCRKGKRPSFSKAASPDMAEVLYQNVCRRWEQMGIKLATGEFQAKMLVHADNDGPVTLLLDSKKDF